MTKTVTIAATADLHGHLPPFAEIPDCDVLVIAGDIGPADRWYHTNGTAAMGWVFGELRGWLEGIRVPVIAIAGNHDFYAQEYPVDFRDLPWHYLEDEAVTIQGVKFYGSPYTPKLGDWAFMKEDSKLAEHWERIPADVDVLVTHGPAYGRGDRDPTGEHAGSRTLRAWLDGAQARGHRPVHLFGHIHASAGDSAHGYDGAHYWQNVAYTNDRYQPAHPVRLLELQKKDGEKWEIV